MKIIIYMLFFFVNLQRNFPVSSPLPLSSCEPVQIWSSFNLSTNNYSAQNTA